VGQLAEAFFDAGGKSGEAALEPEAREAALLALHERGRGAHPSFEVAAVDFATHLGRCGAAADGSVGIVHAEDLFLACACLRRTPGAIERLRDLHRPNVLRQARRTSGAAEFLDEVEQRLWATLLVGGGTPRLAT